MRQQMTVKTTPTYGRGSYADVMAYLYSLPITPEVKRNVGQRLMQEVTEPALAEAFARIDHLATLRKGWAGKGSLAISRIVLKNLKQVLLISNNADWEEWSISPDVNSTVGLQSKSKQALISLGTKEFSFYVEHEGKEKGDSHIAFSPEAFLNVMREIA